MDLTPSQIANASFRTVRKGYDVAEVDEFLARVSQALERCQQQATAMEARARAAVSRLQEVTATERAAPPALAEHVPERVVDAEPAVAEPDDAEAIDDEPVVDEDPAELYVTAHEAETISRTLLLAQRTADSTIAEAEAEAERIRQLAQVEAESTIDSTREMSAKLLEDARTEARRATEAERAAAENEVQSLKARREFLVGDVDTLEQFLIDQRERLRGAARQIEALCDRVPAGLGAVQPPVLSASDDEPGDDTSELFRPAERAPDGDGDDLPDTEELDRPPGDEVADTVADSEQTSDATS